MKLGPAMLLIYTIEPLLAEFCIDIPGIPVRNQPLVYLFIQNNDRAGERCQSDSPME